MAYLFACFVFYSLIGFFIEVIYARLTHARKLDRKCYLLAPLCPVYGLGALSILALPPFVLQNPLLLFLCGGILTTAVEYLTGLFYHRGVGVRFWDYSAQKGHLHSYICFQFTVFWGLLSCALYYFLHPAVQSLLLQAPLSFVQALFVLLSLDGVLSLMLLHFTGSTEVLKWYAMPFKKPAQPAILSKEAPGPQ